MFISGGTGIGNMAYVAGLGYCIFFLHCVLVGDFTGSKVGLCMSCCAGSIVLGR